MSDEKLSTEQVLSALQRPIFVLNMTKSGARARAKTPMERSVRTRHDNAFKQVEDILGRWKGPEDE